MAKIDMNRALNGLNNPLAYMGINASGVYDAASQTVTVTRIPNQNDSKGFILGCFWLKPNTLDFPADNARLFVLTAILGDNATWTEMVSSFANGVLTVTGGSGGAVGPLLGNINLLAGAGSGLSVVGNPGTNTLTIAGTGGSAVINQIDGDIGSITGPTVSIKSNSLSGKTVLFEAVSATAMDFKVTDVNNNTTIGLGAGGIIPITGQSNTSVGLTTLFNLGSGDFNSAFGALSGNLVTTGSNNTLLGAGSAQALITGSNNIAIGVDAALSYTGAESNNIVIGSAGTIADSGRIRIGTTGTHSATHIAGIDGVSVGSVAEVVTMSAAGDQLGTAVITEGAGITVTAGANLITIAATASGLGSSIISSPNNAQTSTTEITYVSLYRGAFGSSITAGQDVIPMNGTIDRLYIKLNSNADTSNSTWTLNVNGVNTTLVVTTTALTTGFFSDLVNSAVVSQGDLVVLECSMATVGTANGTLVCRFTPS